MHNIQRIAVTCDFSLIAVARCRAFIHKPTQAGFSCSDALNGVGCLGTLYFGNLNQPLELPRFLFYICGLFSFVLMNQRQIVDDLITPFPVFQTCIIKTAHLVTSRNYSRQL